MELTKENLQEWKAELSRLMMEQHGVNDFGSSWKDKDWLDQMEGGTPQDAIDEEISYWD